ncbi:MAG: hypothetical protein KGQ56_05085, partial [Acidobacteria bacterium]|nr:hypothetical protein [Acidobacteriota bacterium]
MKFVDSAGNQIGSTQLGRQILLAAAGKPELAAEINSVKNWRKEYLSAFRSIAKLELMNDRSALEVSTRGLAEFERSVLTDDNQILVEAVRNSWRLSKDAVSIVVVSGTGLVKKPEVNADQYIEQHLAEPGVKEALQNFSLDHIDENLLIALAGGAEYSPARTWLDWGGHVAIVARARESLWVELISHARNSAGTLYVPVLKSKVDAIDIEKISDAELAKIAGLD